MEINGYSAHANGTNKPCNNFILQEHAQIQALKMALLQMLCIHPPMEDTRMVGQFESDVTPLTFLTMVPLVRTSFIVTAEGGIHLLPNVYHWMRVSRFENKIDKHVNGDVLNEGGNSQQPILCVIHRYNAK